MVQKIEVLGCGDGLTVKGSHYKAWLAEFKSQDHIVEGEKQPLQLSPDLHTCCGACIPQIKKNPKLKKKPQKYNF